MKKIIIYLMVFCMMFIGVGCGNKDEAASGDKTVVESEEKAEEEPAIQQEIEDAQKETEESKPEDSAVFEEATAVPETSKEPQKDPQAPSGMGSNFCVDVGDITDIDELETYIDEHFKSLIASLYSDWEALSLEIDSYEKYCENQSVVSEFYATVIDETEQMCITIYEYSAIYARMVLDSDMSGEDKYDCIEGINKFIYEDVCEMINDEIYDGLLEDMKDYYYDGILEDAQDSVKYDDWYDICSDEYDQWYDAGSEVYDLYYDTSSDIYSFYYDMSGELYSKDFERAEKVYDKFLQKIDKAKGFKVVNESFPNINFEITIRTASTAEKLEENIDNHVSECIQSILIDWDTLSQEIDTYEEYIENLDKIEDFHMYVEDSTNTILLMINEYAIAYAELIMNSDTTNKDKYDDFEDIKECIYEDACEMVKDEIYDDLMDDIKDYYYDGILKDAKGDVEYSFWSDIRSDAYGWMSDARSEVYDDYSDARSDIYGFYSDMRSELYSGDITRANKVLQGFKDEVNKNK